MKTTKLHFLTLLKTLFSLSPVLYLVFEFNVWAFFGVIVFIVIRYLSFSVSLSGGKIILKGGIVWSFKKEISTESITFFNVESPLFLRIFYCRRVFVYSSFTKGVDLLLPRGFANTLLKSLNLKSTVKEYSPKFSRCLISSLLFSNSLVGIVGVVTFLTQLRRVVLWFGQHLPKIPYIPLSLSVLAGAVVVGWIVAFFKNLLKYISFSLKVKNGVLTTDYGIIYKHKDVCSLKNKCLIIKENLFSKIFGVSSLFIKGENRKKLVLVPAVSKRGEADFLSGFCNFFKVIPPTLKPDFYSFLRYLTLPVLLCVFTVFLKPLFPFALFISVWYFTVKAVDIFRTGIGREGDYFSVYYSKGFSFYTVCLKQKNIVFVKFSQSVIQRFFKNCNVTVFLKGDVSVSVKNIDFKKAKLIFKEDFVK